MDHRIALRPNTQLHFCKDNGEVIHCVIEKEIGRGGSCIVYEASRETDTGDKILHRVKECYPYKLNITRKADNTLMASQQNTDEFIKIQQQFRSDFSRTNRLFYSGSNYASMTNLLDIFMYNGTSYILSAYSSKETLASYKAASIKECISIVMQVAHIIGNIHKNGYLYLDVKPDNVLIVDGIQKQVWLFDFDSLVSISDINNYKKLEFEDLRLSYSGGFAPIELQTAKIKRLGMHTDVYSVGALLFYILFGIAPKAVHCESDAKYNFKKMCYDYSKCDCRLFKALSEFFHNTLAVYYADRYANMDVVCEQLQKLESYADVTIPRIYSTNIIRPKYLFGREDELIKLEHLLATSTQDCLFITGIGGIGKSTFIKEFLCRNEDSFDTILYMQYKDSIENTISDDKNIRINTFRQEDEIQSPERYFDKKINKIRELTDNTTAIIVIDNFNGEVDNDLRSLLSTGCKIILITRKAPNYQSCEKLELGAIDDMYSLRQIFEIGLGRKLEEYEYKTFEEMLCLIDKHTLILELIAKQIASSYISLEKVVAITKEYGFSKIALEKVDYEKDNISHSDTIGNIIDALFEASSLSIDKQVLLKVVSLIGDAGIDIIQFHQILQLKTKDNINELVREGWLTLSDNKITMHNVIQEAVRSWEWNSSFIKAAELFLTYFYVEIRLETTKNNFPKKLYDYLKYKDYPVSPIIENSTLYQKIIAWRDRVMEKQFQKHGLVGEVTRERWLRIGDQSPANIQKIFSLLLQAEDILRQCRKDTVIKNNEIYIELLYITLLNFPQYKKDYIFRETSNIFSNDEVEFVVNGANELLASDASRNPITIMQLYAKVVLIYAETKDPNKANEIIQQAKKVVDGVRHPMVYAQYYNLLSDYYDILLNGAYDSEKNDEELLLSKMMEAIEQTLRYSKKLASHDGGHLYIKNILAKATILLRSTKGNNEEIIKLLAEAKKMIIEYTLNYADVRLQYYLVCAWYYALECNDIKTTEVFIHEADLLSEKITTDDLQKIEEIIIPCANIYFELGAHTKAIELLFKGTRLCVQYSNTDAYDNIKQELCDHIWQVGIEAQLYERCTEILKIIDYENDGIINVQNKIVIPDNIRKVITRK